ncbi:MAG: chemotaxis protein CheA [Nitrospirae bacterium]|nr:chemotaxis protein CheA [Nitrospirota bacterium]
MSVKKQDVLLKDFMAEAEEIIETMEQNLYALDTERNSASGASPNTVHSMFRAIHTLKGAAGMIGLISLSSLSHHMEDLLDRLRLGKLNVTDPMISLLTEATQLLRMMLQSLNTPEQKPIDAAPMISRIEKMLGQGPDGEAPPPEGEGLGIDPEILKTFTEYETHRLKENLKNGLRIFEMQAKYKIESFDLDLGRTLEQIKPHGEVITSLPASGLSPGAGILFKIIIASREDLVHKEIKWSGESVEISEIERSAGPLVPVFGSSDPQTGPAGSNDEASESFKSVTQTVRVDISKLDVLMNIVGELVLSKTVIQQQGKALIDKNSYSDMGLDFQKTLERIGRKIGELQESLIQVRMTPIGQIFGRFVRMVRKISREIKKPVNIHISGEETALDKSMIESIADPLMHLIRNAIDHGLESKDERTAAGKPETGNIYLRAFQKGNHVLIEVEDDGQGIELQSVYQKALEKNLADPKKEYSRKELIDFLFLPGFSTSKTITDLSGRGVGLDVVAKNIGKMSGMVSVETDPGRGAKFSITLPITLIIIRALIVKIGGNTYAIPINSVSESLMVNQKNIQSVDAGNCHQIPGRRSGNPSRNSRGL